MSRSEETASRDSVDAVIDQWARERPDLPVAPVGVVTRLARVRTHLDAALAEVFAGFDLTPADFQALVTLRRIGSPYRMGQARLMDALGLTSGTVSVRLARLEQRGVVVREPDPADKRSSTVRLTDKGLELFDRIAPLHLTSEDRLLSALTPDEQTQLANLLRKLLASFEHTGPQAARMWGMTLEPARTARLRRAAVGLSDRPGLLVTHVAADSPAHRAGIKCGDLITHRTTRPVRTTEDLTAPDGQPVALRLLRGDRRVEATLFAS
ncbi:MarR family transcriptional regulator [Streptacidiphilus neutrinimicus]|uniref:MarR family transcriptional regulator n=1 Tax=Streptacidiphilus neutrinimicus TaxID=105420 RepID=UPI0013779EFA|nr:MarR family transcriptional regulator [Streptacidiphilus neutrinimicus]